MNEAAIIGSLVLFFILIFAGMPVAFALGLCGIVAYTMITGFGIAVSKLALAAYGTMANFILSPLPLFILMGQLIASSGIGRDLYDTAWLWTGKLPAGLGVASILACAIFAAMCGVSMAGAAAIGLVAIPEMLKRGYDKKITAGTLAAGGTLGILIPPSVPFVLYGTSADQSIGRLFIAGVMPGVLLVTLMSLYVVIRAIKEPKVAPPLVEKVSWKARLLSLRGTVWPILLVILVLGGIYTGIVTISEAGGIGAFGAFLIFVFRGKFAWRDLINALGETSLSCGYIFIIVVGAMFFGYAFAVTGATKELANFILASGVNPWVVIAGIVFLLIILGMFLDPASIILLTTPILMPILKGLGFDPIWYGVILVICMEMAFLTPPVGMNLYVIRGIAPQIPLREIIWGSLPFVIIQIVAVIIVCIFPQIALWLPSLMMK